MHTHDVEMSPRTRRILVWVTAVVGVAVGLAIVALSLGTEIDRSGSDFLSDDVYEATVEEVRLVPCAGTDLECVEVEVRLNQGPDDGETRVLTFTRGQPSTPDLSAGDEIVLSYFADAEEGFEYDYADRQRRNVLLGAALLFVLAVVLLGRVRGLAALGGLAASVVVILVFILPAILDGYSPVLVAVLGAAGIAYIALYLSHGFNMLTTVALLGTLAALGLTILLSALFTALAEFSGFATEEALLVSTLADGVDMQGVVLAGIVIGALGALDDVTVTQASAIAELREANPDMSRRSLYRSGLRVGRDHIASTVNTLALAYAGAALPLLLLFVLSEQSLGTIANSEVMATELVRTLVGSIGLVASVPITTWLAARVVPGPARPTDEDDAWEREKQARAEAGEQSFW